MASRNAFKVFVGNLPWTVGHRELRQHFSQFGHVVSSNVIFNRSTGLSKHYGFVQFANRTAYDSAINKTSQVLEGNVVDVFPTK